MKIIYVGDPMCSWCYGIAPEWLKVVDHYKETADLELVMGGLRPYYQAKMTEMKDFLSEHWRQVHEATGQPFSYGILDNASLSYDTEPPCRAVVIVRDLAPQKAIAFFKATQAGFYNDNIYLGDPSAYHSILEKLEISTTAFDKAFNSVEYKEKVKADFAHAKTLGVNSFPTILVEKDGVTTIVASGYSNSSKIIAAIEKATN